MKGVPVLLAGALFLVSWAARSAPAHGQEQRPASQFTVSPIDSAKLVVCNH